jgi:NADPH:quinone reductase-like Zn-dependent oxidoreductase
MKAITQQAFGGPEVLEETDRDRPTPLPTDVLVRVRAIGLNPVEPLIRAGVAPLLGQPPFVLGWDLSGVVEEAQPRTWRFDAGDEVFGMPQFPRPAETYAEYVAAPAVQLVRKPPALSHAEAAALPLAGLTAWQALVDLAKLQGGERVLIHAAGGGVGHLAVQIAKHLGAEVTATCSATKADWVRDLGADRVIDYGSEDFATAVDELDVVLDLVGGGYAERSLPILRQDGLLITAVERPNAALADATKAAGRRFAAVAVDPDGAALQTLADLAAEGTIRVHVDESFALGQAAEAHIRLEAGNTRGKMVLEIP